MTKYEFRLDPQYRELSTQDVLRCAGDERLAVARLLAPAHGTPTKAVLGLDGKTVYSVEKKVETLYTTTVSIKKLPLSEFDV
jgi:hypothetical protein